MIVDKPVWEVKPKGTYSSETFFIGLGDKFKESEVIPNPVLVKSYQERGYAIIEAPIDFKENALKDLNRMLCDYAGISNFSSNKFISPGRLADVVTAEFKNPMPDVIEVGDGNDDTAEYQNFFNFDLVNKELLKKPLFIHLDMSLTGDKTGIAGVWIVDKQHTTEGNPGKDLFFQPAFSFSVKAPYGRQISFRKNRMNGENKEEEECGKLSPFILFFLNDISSLLLSPSPQHPHKTYFLYPMANNYTNTV